jgi:hypothetical protein
MLVSSIVLWRLRHDTAIVGIDTLIVVGLFIVFI